MTQLKLVPGSCADGILIEKGCQWRFYRKDLLGKVFISADFLDKFGKKSLIRISFVRKVLLENRFSEEFY